MLNVYSSLARQAENPVAAVGAAEEESAKPSAELMTVLTFARIAGVTSGAYHGYKRNNNSIGWAIGWGLLGGIFWPVTIPVSLAQGYGKPKSAKD